MLFFYSQRLRTYTRRWGGKSRRRIEQEETTCAEKEEEEEEDRGRGSIIISSSFFQPRSSSHFAVAVGRCIRTATGDLCSEKGEHSELTKAASSSAATE